MRKMSRRWECQRMMAEEWKWNVEQWRIQDLKKGGGARGFGENSVGGEVSGGKRVEISRRVYRKRWKITRTLFPTDRRPRVIVQCAFYYAYA